MPGANDCRESLNQHRFTIGERSPSLAVIESIAQLKDEDPLSLPQLANHTDPQSIDHFISRTDEGILRFEYDGFEVEVSSSGDLLITGPTV